MTTDLFLAPALPRKLPSSFQCDRTDSSASARGPKTHATGLSTHAKPENFMSTLQRASRDQHLSRGSRSPDSGAETRSATSDLHSEKHQVADQKPTDEERQMEADESSPKEPSMVAAELSELLTLLEALGWTGDITDRMDPAGGGATSDNMSLTAEKGSDILAAFKQLIADIQSADLKQGNELSAGLEQLRQIIARALTSDASMSNPDIAQDGPNPNQSQVALELARWAKGIIQGQDSGVMNNASTAPGEAGSTEKASDLSRVPDRIAADPAAVSDEQHKADAPRLNPQMGISVEEEGSARDTKGPDSRSARNSENQTAGKVADGHRNVPFGHSLRSASGSSLSGGEPPQENSVRVEASPISKAADDTTAGKDNPLKVETVLGADAGSKVIKSEGGTHDGGQWTSHSQTPARTFETASATKEAEGAQRELRTHTMDQIVRRAVFQIKGGQQEARIDLKPDFLGHVRMQVITESQQVTVKILTEFGFVKDMIENNIQQLKADLQQQGLAVDKVDVSVSRDANGGNQQQQNMQHGQNRPFEDNSADHGHHSGEGQRDTADRSARKTDGSSTVDYFA